MEPTINAIIENIPPALSEDAEVAETSYSSFWSVEATDFKNVILDKIHWAASEASEI